LSFVPIQNSQTTPHTLSLYQAHKEIQEKYYNILSLGNDEM